MDKELKNLVFNIFKKIAVIITIIVICLNAFSYYSLAENTSTSQSSTNPENFNADGTKSTGLNAVFKGEFFYEGIPKGHYGATAGFFERLVNFFAELFDYIIGLILNILLKLPLIGYATIVEILLTNALSGLTGQENYIDRQTGMDLYIDSRRAVNVENIIFGRIEALNIDFFVTPEKVAARTAGLTGTGQSIDRINESARLSGDSGTAREYNTSNDTIRYEDSVPGLLRANFAKVYYAIYSISLLTMIFALATLAVYYLMTKTVEEESVKKKIKIKSLLISWGTAFIRVVFNLLFVFFIIKLNNYLVAGLAGKAGINDPIYEGTRSLYETIRTRAYSNKFTIGFPAAIIYFILVWYTVRFTFIYAKRLIILLVLSLGGPLVPAYELLRGMMEQKPEKSDLFYNWQKEFAFLVLIQVIHAGIFTMTIKIVLDLTSVGVIGFIFAIYIMRLMLTYSGEIRKLFNLQASKHSAISNVLDKTTPFGELKSLEDKASAFYIFREAYKREKKLYKAGKKSEFPEIDIHPIKKLKKVVGSTARNAVNLGVFTMDIFKNKLKRKNSIENYFNSGVLEERESKVNEVLSKVDTSEEEKAVIAKYLHSLSNEDLNSYSNVDMSNVTSLEDMFPKDISKRKAKNIKKLYKFKQLLDAQKGIFSIDENGNYRILPPVKEFDIKTGKTKVVTSASKEYFKNLAAIFGKTPQEIKDGVRNVADNSLTALATGLGILSGIMIMPAAITDFKKVSGYEYFALGNSVKVVKNALSENKKRKIKVSRRKAKRIYKYGGLDPNRVNDILEEVRDELVEVEKNNKITYKVNNKNNRQTQNLRDINDLKDAIYINTMIQTQKGFIDSYISFDRKRNKLEDVDSFFDNISLPKMDTELTNLGKEYISLENVYNSKKEFEDKVLEIEETNIDSKVIKKLKNKELRNMEYDILDVSEKYSLNYDDLKKIAELSSEKINTKFITTSGNLVDSMTKKLLFTESGNLNKILEENYSESLRKRATKEMQKLGINVSDEISEKIILGVIDKETKIIDEEVEFRTVNRLETDKYAKAINAKNILYSSINSQILEEAEDMDFDNETDKQDYVKQKYENTINNGYVDDEIIKDYLSLKEEKIYKEYMNIKKAAQNEVINENFEDLFTSFEERTRVISEDILKQEEGFEKIAKRNSDYRKADELAKNRKDLKNLKDKTAHRSETIDIKVDLANERENRAVKYIEKEENSQEIKEKLKREKLKDELFKYKRKQNPNFNK